MQRIMKCFFLCFFLFFTVGKSDVSAKTQDGLEVTIETDKETYQRDDKIYSNVKITNHNAYVVDDVTITFTLPEEIKSSDDIPSISIEHIQPGETKTYDLGALEQRPITSTDINTDSSLQNDSINSGDSNNAMQIAMVFFVAGGILYVLVKTKHRKTLAVTVFMILGISATSQTVVQAKIIEKSMEITQPLPYSNDELSITAYITYAFEDGINTDTSTITKEEWVVALVDEFNLTSNMTTPYSFDDFEHTKNADKIEIAIRNNLIDIHPDEDNMTYFQPTDAATREFIAYTAINALRYDYTTIESLNCLDQNQLSYPKENAYAVKLGLLSLSNDQFLPNQTITRAEADHALSIIKSINKSTQIDENHNNTIIYKDTVKTNKLSYTLDEPNKKVIFQDYETIKDWNIGEIHLLESEDKTQMDVAIKISTLIEKNGKGIIVYTTPDLSEVIESMDVEGITSKEGSLVLAEGVTLVEDETPKGRSTVHDTIPLFGKKTISIEKDGSTISGSLDIKNLEYRFVSNPSWHIIDIDEIYFALNSSVSFDLSSEFANGEKSIVLAHFSCPLGYGFNAFGEITLNVSASGEISIGVEITNKAGIQYTDERGIRPIFNLDTSLNAPSLSANLKAGVGLDVGADWFGIDLVSTGVEFGESFDGELNNVTSQPPQFCLDGQAYSYLTLAAEIGSEDIGLSIAYEKELINDENSPWKLQLHFEETGLKDECSHGNGDYEGSVKRADQPDQGIAKTKIQIMKGSRLLDTTYTDNDGNFKGLSLNSGIYKIRVSASGYFPYEQKIEIIGGSTTYVKPQLMINRSGSSELYTYSGTITNAFTAQPISDVKIEISSQSLSNDGSILSTIYSDENGTFSLQMPAGNYLLSLEKDGYTSDSESIAIANNSANHQIVLNPSDQVTIDGAWRAVLTWGDKPNDLDSHLIGTSPTDRFHTYYASKNSPDANLDVDDINKYGPETITSKGDKTTYYKYYVHDYSNKFATSSSILAQSKAQVKIYVGSKLLYTINIPSNKMGTLWHVFDYDATTGKVTLVNAFSYESSPSNIGNMTRNMSLPITSDNKEVWLKNEVTVNQEEEQVYNMDPSAIKEKDTITQPMRKEEEIAPQTDEILPTTTALPE